MLPMFARAPRRSRADSLYPATKVLWLIAVCAAALCSGRLVVLLALLGLLWSTSLAAGLAGDMLWQVTRLSLPFCLALVVLQVAFRHEGPPVFAAAGFSINAGALSVALLGILRIQCLALAGAQFWQWTHPTDLALMLLAWGVPYRYAFLPTVAFRAFPLLSHELERVLEGQQLLGVELRRGLTQVWHFPRLFIPFCIATLSAGNDMALAMEMRGFGGQVRRTHLRHLTVRWWDYAASAACLVAICYFTLGPGR